MLQRPGTGRNDFIARAEFELSGAATDVAPQGMIFFVIVGVGNIFLKLTLSTLTNESS
jgi:hypothetical protein